MNARGGIVFLRWLPPPLACLLLGCFAAAAGAGETPVPQSPVVMVAGAVHRPGPHTLAPGARLLQAAQAASVRPDAYLLGAAWHHRPAVAEQAGLKAGILHDLTVLIRHARIENLDARAELGQRLRAEVERLPVTGRVPVSLDPVRLELERRHNRPIAHGDKLIYPRRPDTVVILGAVVENCTLPFVALKAAAEYAAACPAHPEADPDWLHVIQPDGHVQRLGVAPWNRGPAQPLAPGASVLRPLRALADDPAPALNAELAAFIATQPLPAEGARP